jgi:hypothetical protein
MCHASLWSADKTREVGITTNPRYRYDVFEKTPETQSDELCQTLIGCPLVSAQVFADMDSQHKVFFLFTDLSVRVQGDYCLKLQLLSQTLDTEGSHAITAIDCCFTQPFHVYPAKTFPGIKGFLLD